LVCSPSIDRGRDGSSAPSCSKELEVKTSEND
jgi:hypothetical protein